MKFKKGKKGIRDLTVQAIPVSSIDHPDPPSDILPRHEFTIGLIAPKGSGKTTVLIRLLDFYRGFFHRIVIFSPTVKNDEKWDWVKTQKLLAKNTALDLFIREIKNKKSKAEKISGVVERGATNDDEVKELNKYLTPDDFDGRVGEEFFLNDYDESTLVEVMQEQDKLIDTLKNYGKTKHLAHRLLIIFDDLVGSSLFSGRKNNPFKKLNTNHRHYSCSIIEVTQAYKEIPRTVRTQFSCMIIFEIPNDTELDCIREENGCGYHKNAWYEIYRYAVAGDHDFLYINNQKPLRMRMMKNFKEILFVKEAPPERSVELGEDKSLPQK